MRGYYYTEDNFCFYICNEFCEEYNIPLQKEHGLYILSENAVKNIVDDLNEQNSDLFLDVISMYNEFKKRL